MLGFWLTVAGAFLVGASVISIAYAVYCKITRGNLPEIIRTAMKGSEEQKAKELLAEILQARVDHVEDNIISISILEGSDNVPIQLTITGSEVDSCIYEGMELTA